MAAADEDKKLAESIGEEERKAENDDAENSAIVRCLASIDLMQPILFKFNLKVKV